MPTPARMRQMIRSQTANARPDPMELIANSAAAMSMTRTRPYLSAAGPANQAPAAEPSRAQATAKPDSSGLSCRPNWSFRASTAPLMTLESKPKRKPPTAATMEMRIALAVVFSREPGASGRPDADPESVLIDHSPERMCRH